jgi:hypothetical protein
MLDNKMTSSIMEWTGLGDSIMKRYEKFSAEDDEIKRRRQLSNKHKEKKRKSSGHNPQMIIKRNIPPFKICT